MNKVFYARRIKALAAVFKQFSTGELSSTIYEARAGMAIKADPATARITELEKRIEEAETLLQMRNRQLDVIGEALKRGETVPYMAALSREKIPTAEDLAWFEQQAISSHPSKQST